MIQVVIKFLPLALNATDAAEYIGSGKVFEDMKKAGWVHPNIGGSHRTMLFDRKDLESAYARYYAGEYPAV